MKYMYDTGVYLVYELKGHEFFVHKATNTLWKFCPGLLKMIPVNV